MIISMLDAFLETRSYMVTRCDPELVTHLIDAHR